MDVYQLIEGHGFVSSSFWFIWNDIFFQLFNSWILSIAGFTLRNEWVCMFVIDKNRSRRNSSEISPSGNGSSNKHETEENVRVTCLSEWGGCQKGGKSIKYLFLQFRSDAMYSMYTTEFLSQNIMIFAANKLKEKEYP